MFTENEAAWKPAAPEAVHYTDPFPPKCLILLWQTASKSLVSVLR